MILIDWLEKAITGGKWFVAYKTRNEKKYRIARTPERQWSADPFVYEANGEHYIFVEQYIEEKQKGAIGYYKIIDNIPVYQGIVIENSYHMSYPNIFSYKGKHYMIPESSANNTVDLYEAEKFPDRWKKIETLIDGEKLVDTTVFFIDQHCYLFSYSMVNGYEIRVYELDMEKRSIVLLSRKGFKTNIGRPGGRLFYNNGRLFRPAQNCSKKYGEELIIYEVENINNDGAYLEHEEYRISSDNLEIGMHPERVHQYTADNTYEVIDVFKERIDLLHIPKVYFRSRRK